MEEAQINIRCSKAVSERLKAITKAERIKSGDLLEKLLDCYQDSINRYGHSGNGHSGNGEEAGIPRYGAGKPV